MSLARELLLSAILWRDSAKRAESLVFRRLWRRNMRDCALAWREALREEEA